MEQGQSSVDRAKILRELKSAYDGSDKRNITFALPEKLLKAFKKDCDKQGLKMNKVVQKLMEDYLK
jgi:predicted DNA binding CopG/RHH family protein